MKTETAFTGLATQFLDRWLQTTPDAPCAPSTIYNGLIGRMTIKMRLTVTHTVADRAEDWRIEPVRHSSLLTRLIDLNALFGHGRLADFADQDYIQVSVLPRYSELLTSQKPKIETIQAKLLKFQVGYDRILLPQKNRSRPEWILALSNGRFLAQQPPPSGVLDAEDQLLLQLLSEGASAREIADTMALSSRTVEHRIERLKTRFGARNVVNLVAIALSREVLGVKS